MVEYRKSSIETMPELLKQFVPQGVCLRCEGCCRFSGPDSDWRPKIVKSDRAVAARACARDGRLLTRSGEGCAVCRFFCPEDNTCSIYPERPFECRLYPFLLGRSQGNVRVAVHLSCPHIQDSRHTPAFDAYTAYLKEWFAQPDTRRWIEDIKDELNDYTRFEREIEYLFDLETEAA